VDPVRNPYAPGAGQRPPELAGRDRELEAFEVVLERVARGRPERSLVLTGLRGVGKTVLLNTLRSQAISQLWGAGKIEARPDQSLRRPLSAALHMAVRELAPRHRAPDRIDEFLGVLKAFALRSTPTNAKLRDRWQPGIDVPAATGRADSGDIEIDLVELFTDAAGIAIDVGTMDPLYASNQQLHDKLTQLHVPHYFEEYEGDHTNKVRDRIERNVLPFFSKNLASPVNPTSPTPTP